MQACPKESGFPTGVLCDAMWELQRYMAPLVALRNNEIVEASLLRPIEECGTSPTPQEKTALLGKIKLPQVPEQLEVHEQVHPPEWIAAPTAYHPSPPSQPGHLPSQKEKKPQEGIKGHSQTWTVGLWLLGEEWQVPKWWRKFWSLLQDPGDSPIQKEACHQAVAF